MRTIAIVNQKGGCGKTTVSINLASTLADLGKKTLLLDMDPQSHCAVGLAVPEEQIEQSIYDVLISKSRNEPVRLTEILWQISDNLELAPSSIDLSAFEQQMTGIAERECCLRNVLKDAEDTFDYVIIDCPPAVGLLTFNALKAASDVIVPVETGYFALHGLSKQLETLNILCQRTSQLVNVRILASMYDIRTKMAREILSELRTHFSDKMFKTTVNFNTKIKEASSFGQPISEYDSASKGQLDFKNLAEEVIAAESKQQRHELVNSLSSQLEDITVTADELLQAANKPVKEIIAVKSKAKQPDAQPVEELIEADLTGLINNSPEEIFQTELPVPAEELASAPRPIEETKPIDLPAPCAEVAEVIDNTPLAEIKEIETPKPANPQPTNLDEKLCDYYGVNQIQDSISFVTLYPRAEIVQIAGDFNNWQPGKAPLEKVGQNGVWQTKMNLPAGRYRYRLVVDGQWQQDPYNELVEANPFGGFNSIVEVH